MLDACVAKHPTNREAGLAGADNPHRNLGHSSSLNARARVSEP